MTNSVLFKRWLVIFASLLIMSTVQHTAAQGPSTPIPVKPPTATASQLPPTDLPSRTPTSMGPASIEAITDGTNVRSQPDIGSERVGQIFPGQNFTVLGRRFEWLQIIFSESPSGIGWVHESVVVIKGDENLIPDLTLEEVPTENPTIISGRETARAITATPGAILTLTALVQLTPNSITGPQAGVDDDAPQAENLILPTFTFPAETVTPIKLEIFSGRSSTRSGGDGVPPILPILGLIGAGSLGLLLAFLRR